MNLGRSLLLGGMAVVVLASGVAGQSPSPAASPSPSAPPSADPPPATSPSPAPSATPFPWPTIPRQRLARGTFPEWPTGKLTASTADRGIRLDLWLSSTEAAPGDWIQAIVRATNVGDDTAWVRIGDECLQETMTEVNIDLRPVTPMGKEQTGAVAAFKATVIERYLEDHFRSPEYAYRRRASGPTVRVFAECTLPAPRFLVTSLAPGATRTERFIWRAVRVMEERRGGRLQPLPPGSVSVTAGWAMAGRGSRPGQERLARRGRPISVTAPLELTGTGPGTPSIPELVDRALVDPGVPGMGRACGRVIEIGGLGEHPGHRQPLLRVVRAAGGRAVSGTQRVSAGRPGSGRRHGSASRRGHVRAGRRGGVPGPLDR